VPKKAEPKGEIGVKTIEGGKYAMFLYTGSYEHLNAVYDAVYAKWLPENGYKLRNCHCFEKYLNNPADTLPEKLKTGMSKMCYSSLFLSCFHLSRIFSSPSK
jgi:AraC family transcriptional regulator